MSAGILTRNTNCATVLAHIENAAVPQTYLQIRTATRLTKRATEDAIWFLMSTHQIAYGEGLPFTYKPTGDRA